jgi:protein gp37
MNKTSISWTDLTWNPTTGCTKISPGCAYCYAERIARRFWGRRDFDDLKFHPERLEFPLKIKKPQRIFVDSMSDLFHPVFTDELIYRVFKVIYKAYWHTFQILTKRPSRMAEIVPRIRNMLPDRLNNVWLGVSIENQKTAYERLQYLMDTPAAVRFISCEPLLEYVDLVEAHRPKRIRQAQYISFKRNINWVICGGETGPGARPMHIEWVRELRDQCKNVGIPFFFKSWGEFKPLSLQDDMDRLPVIMAPGLEVMARVGRRKSGRLLDGVEWSEFPAD